MTDRDPAHLHPLALDAWERLRAAAASRLGLTLDLIETWRDGAAQEAAKAAGASKKGAGGSWHNVTYPTGKPASLALHCDPFPGPPVLGYGPKVLEWEGAVRFPVEFRPGRTPRPCTAAALVLTAVGALGEELGLTWGGRWDDPMDWLHFELRVGTLSQVLAAMRASGDILGLVPGRVRA